MDDFVAIQQFVHSAMSVAMLFLKRSTGLGALTILSSLPVET